MDIVEILLNWKTILSVSLSAGGLIFAVYRFLQMRQSRIEDRLAELEKINAVQNEQIVDLRDEVNRLRDSVESLVQNMIRWLQENK